MIQAPEDTQSYNRYSYVFNNPLSYTDPSGNASLAAGEVGSLVGGVSAFGVELAIQLYSGGDINTVDLASATAGGMGAGFVVGTLGTNKYMPIAAGAAGGFSSSTIDEFASFASGGEFSVNNIVKDTLGGTIVGFAAEKVINVTNFTKITKITKITAGGLTGKYTLTKLQRTMITKLRNGTLKPSQLSKNTWSKLVALGAIQGVPTRATQNAVDGTVSFIEGLMNQPEMNGSNNTFVNPANFSIDLPTELRPQMPMDFNFTITPQKRLTPNITIEECYGGC